MQYVIKVPKGWFKYGCMATDRLEDAEIFDSADSAYHCAMGCELYQFSVHNLEYAKSKVEVPCE